MFNEKLGILQKQKILIIMEFLCCIVWIIANIFKGIGTHEAMIIGMPAMVGAFIVLIILLRISKENSVSVLYVSKYRTLTKSAFLNEVEKYSFHSEIYDIETDNPYYIVTDRNLEKYKIQVIHHQNKWFLIKRVEK